MSLSDFGKTEFLRVEYLNSLSLPSDLNEILWQFSEPEIFGVTPVTVKLVKADVVRDLVIIGNEMFLNCLNNVVYSPDVIEIGAIQRSSILRPFRLKIDTVTGKPYIICENKRIYKIDRKKMDLIEIPFFGFRSIVTDADWSSWQIQDGVLRFTDSDSYITLFEDGRYQREKGQRSPIDNTIRLTEDVKVVYDSDTGSVRIGGRRLFEIKNYQNRVPSYCVGDEFFFLDDRKSQEYYQRLRMKFQ
jgi:hypothetical protein